MMKIPRANSEATFELCAIAVGDALRLTGGPDVEERGVPRGIRGKSSTAQYEELLPARHKE